jgi:ATP-dependent Clp protease ATP-binding subunit ClpC
MTSNVGADRLKKSTEVGFGASEKALVEDYESLKELVMEAVKKQFKPEFINRLNDAVIFKALDKEALVHVVEIEFKKLAERLSARQLYVEIDEEAKRFLVEKGYQPEMGARPVRRIIEEYIEGPIAEKVLREPEMGRKISITAVDGELQFNDTEVFKIEISTRRKEKQQQQAQQEESAQEEEASAPK